MVSKIKLTEGRKSRGDGRANYTELEKRLFAFLSEKNRISSIEIATRRGDDSIFGRNNVVTRMRQLSDKMVRNGEKWVICKTKQRGPKPTEFWLERKRA